LSRDFEETYAQTGNAPKIKSVYAISLYDPENGNIIHMHHVLNMEGSASLDPQEVEKNLMTTAKQLGHNVEKLKVLHTKDLKDISGNYRVDVEKKILVKVTKQQTKDQSKPRE
jgi:hypothetical protein